MKDIYKDLLNSKQQEAASIIDGPVMVFAGAGTGKTRTLTYRIANMVEEGVDASHILAITFTNKATNEMRERLHKIIPIDAASVTITTFHSWCAKLLRRHIRLLDYSLHFDILDEEDQLKVVGEAIELAGIDKKAISPKYARNVINNCKCFDLKADDRRLQTIYDQYEKLMKEENCLDFEDLLIKTLEIFEKFKDILEMYQEKYQYILVDEFQDTDFRQYRIIKLLALKSRNLFVVGDDDQAIYAFRGADYDNIKKFKRDFPEAKVVVLNENYRSTQKILDGTNNLIACNDDREKKSLFSSIKGNDSDVKIMQLKGDREEVQYVVEEIKDLVRHGDPYNSIAVLYRNSFLSRSFELALINANIPYKIYGGITYLRRKEVKDIIAYLKFITNRNDLNSFKRIVNEPSRGLGKKTIELITNYRNTNHVSIIDAIDKNSDKLANKYKILKEFLKVIDELDHDLDNMPFSEFFEKFLEKTNFLETIKDEENEREREENIYEFKSLLVRIEDNGEVATRREKLIDAFDEAVLADDKLQSQRQSLYGVTLSTIHSVKGLEFKTVFLVAFEEGILPNDNREDIDIEEERRITYVACTRAMKNLYLTCASERMLYGRTEKKSQSRFLLEFIGKKAIIKPKRKTFYDDDYDICQLEDEDRNNDNQESNNKIDNDYHVGDYVNHQLYGDGIIVSLENLNDNLMGKICFTSGGSIKQFMMNHPSIKKIKR